MKKRQIYDNGERIVEGRIKVGSEYGICSTCKFFRVKRTQYGRRVCWCGEDWETCRIPPNVIDPITECADYYPKGQPTLHEMMNMYWKVDKVKRRIGFGNDDYDVTITNPNEKEEEDNDDSMLY
jgi:hypothetical protein